MRGIVPNEILDRRDKVGFATPERHWLNLLDPWVRAALASDTARKMAFLDLSAAERELNLVKEGKRPFGFHIWRWVNLIRWAESLGVVFD
jgi:asparagine synthase (glutamine-hydrolysing)